MVSGHLLARHPPPSWVDHHGWIGCRRRKILENRCHQHVQQLHVPLGKLRTLWILLVSTRKPSMPRSQIPLRSSWVVGGYISMSILGNWSTNLKQENTRQIGDLIGSGIKFKICWTNEQLILWEKELTWLGSAVYCTLCWYVNLNTDWKPSTFPLPAKDLPRHFQDTVQKFMYVKLFVQCVFFSIGNTDSNNKYENTLC